MRYIVIGAGSVGGTVGGLLADAGHDVVLVARGEHLDALRSAGLTVGTPERTFTVRPAAVAGPSELRLSGDDMLLLASKSQDTLAAVTLWAGQPAGEAGLGADLPLFCLQNGVENERTAARWFSAVFGVAVALPAELTAPGQVAASGSPVSGALEIGRYPSGSGAAAERFAADLTGAGFTATVTDRVMDAKYTKLLRNLRNAIAAACGTVRSDAAARLAGLAVAEAEACYAAAGISFTGLRASMAARDGAFTEMPVNGRPRAGSSTWQSLNRRAGSAETDYLNGEIVLLGRLHGVPTPVNELLRRTVSQMAAAGQPPGTASAAGLLAQAERLTLADRP